MSLHDLSLEIHWEILLKLDYPDILNYCKSHPRFHYICADDKFWQYKFEHDRNILAFGDTQLNPKYYAELYKIPNELWSNIYERWWTAQNADFEYVNDTNPIYNLNMYTDIIMFRLDQGFYNLNTPTHVPDGSKTLKLSILAIKHEMDTIIFALYNKYPVLGLSMAYAAIKYDKVHILEWLNHHGIKISQRMITEAYRLQQESIIRWMTKFVSDV